MTDTGDSGPEHARPTAFLSYSHVDQALAQKLAAALEQAGLKIWWDSLIEGGAAFAKSIEAALVQCDAVVVLWSQASTASDWVLDEAGKGRDLRKLVPVSIDGTEPPLGFRQYHALDLSGWRGQADEAVVAALVRAIVALSGKPAPTPRPTAVRSPAPALSRRGVLFGALALAAAGVAGVYSWRRSGSAARGAAAGNSVAVLPFDNISGDPGQDYFSDGLSEEVRATLARNLRLLVMAKTSSSQFREGDADAVGIAGKLGVAYLLDGSVRRAGDKVRVVADLIDGQTGFSRWSDKFDRHIDDVFAVQSEIANAVATAMAAQVASDDAALPGAPGELAASGGTTRVEAFDAYLRGRALYDLSADEASERAALGQFEAAIALDPSYAAAHAARARSLTAIANQYAPVAALAAMYDEAIVAGRRAIELAPAFADAHSTLGFTLFQGRLDARAAREPFERSYALGAGDATVLARFAQYSARIGRSAQAAASMARAVQLDPLNPLIHRAAGSVAYAARSWEAALAPLRQALAMNPQMSRAHAALGDALLMLGRLPEARVEYAAEPVADFRLAGLAVLELRLGNTAAAQAALAALVAQSGDRVLYQQAQVLAQAGDAGAALDRLEKARAVGDSGLIYLRNDPLLDPLHGDPRFARLLAGIGFD